MYILFTPIFTYDLLKRLSNNTLGNIQYSQTNYYIDY